MQVLKISLRESLVLVAVFAFFFAALAVFNPAPSLPERQLTKSQAEILAVSDRLAGVTFLDEKRVIFAYYRPLNGDFSGEQLRRYAGYVDVDGAIGELVRQNPYARWIEMIDGTSRQNIGFAIAGSIVIVLVVISCKSLKLVCPEYSHIEL